MNYRDRKGKKMKTINVFEEGDKVMIIGTVVNVKVENGVHKYQVADIKSNNKIGTWFTGEEIVQITEKKGK